MDKINYKAVISASLALCCLLFPGRITGQDVITTETLLKEMIDRDVIARYPSPSFTCRQFSSYDRASVSKDENWFANWDRSMFEGVDSINGRREFVMMDSKGPGAIVRFWMTFAREGGGYGTMRIYLDGDTLPVIQGTPFDILSGNKIVGEPLASSVSKLTRYERRGHNLYFPIAYAKSCKVTYESERLSPEDFGAKKNSECVYYNINYRTYQPSAKVITFAPGDLLKYQTLIRSVQGKLSAMDRGLKPYKLTTIKLSGSISSGESNSFTIEGSNAIREISMKIEAFDKAQALRSLVMEIIFDGERTVWVPVGDFFGVAYKQVYTNTWYLNCSKDGQMRSYWVMPFARSCRIVFHNFGDETIDIVDGQLKFSGWEWDNRSMHFGSDWHQYSGIVTGLTKTVDGKEKGIRDVCYTKLRGRGVYAGDNLSIFNTNYGWWGEGDEKIFVDGERFPSHFGTGTEDYYGYAWSRPEVFTDHPFIAQPIGDASFAPGLSINTRLRSMDIIPFRDSIDFLMELWHWQYAVVNYAPVTYWYMLPGGRSLIGEDTGGIITKVANRRDDIISSKVQLVIEGESMTAQEIGSGSFVYKGIQDFDMVGGMEASWGKPLSGSKLILRFESDFEGEYSLSGRFAFAPEFGRFNILFNNTIALNNIEFKGPSQGMDIVLMGRVLLKKGVNQVTIEYTGEQSPATGEVFGLDKLQFTPVPE
jgi:hypothetical protein